MQVIVEGAVDMNSTLKAQYTAQTMVLKALAHPARLLIVHELAAKETQTMSGLAGLIGIEISSVCRHLTKLKVSPFDEAEGGGNRRRQKRRRTRDLSAGAKMR